MGGQKKDYLWPSICLWPTKWAQAQASIFKASIVLVLCHVHHDVFVHAYGHVFQGSSYLLLS